MSAPPDFAIRAAVEAGARSPCDKIKRGAVVFSGTGYRDGFILGVGHNAQPSPFACTGDARCRSACGKLCEHAEQVAVREALIDPRADGTLRGLHLVHAKVVDGDLVAGGGPSCWQCSRLVLAVGLDGVWLYQRTWEECLSEDGCSYCAGTACAECEDVPHASRHSPEHHDRHHDLVEVSPRWRYYTAEDFHRATLAACGIGELR
jgi:hypothetical protein